MWRGLFRAFIVAVPAAFCGILTGGAILYAAYGAGVSADSTWKTLGGDFDRAGLSDSNGPRAGCVKWRFETPAAVATSVAVAMEGSVYIACEDGVLYALDSSGEAQFKTGSEIENCGESFHRFVVLGCDGPRLGPRSGRFPNRTHRGD